MLNDDILHAIGRTPLIELRNCSPKPGVRLFAKLEGQNPSGSVKDRIALQMVLAAERTGRLRPGGTIVVASTGNTGIALALVGRVRGYRVRVVMPENIADEIPRTLSAYGATIEWVPAEQGMRKAIDVAQGFAQREGELLLDQFADPLNTQAHYDTTGPEILDDLPGVDVFIAGLGTCAASFDHASTPIGEMIATQARMFARRNVTQRPCDVQLLRDRPYPDRCQI
ncbi:hypothetical protein LCGC14_1716500 [marine sediment metagenome]|uniref:Tryptophan synthase beta chain-like PALP domain-containing protein n=1 Tax=marine sediment metagenome TaxID=412755 RepID=A0A0F9I198_9ZZZZ